jgi:hypothetical protein
MYFILDENNTLCSHPLSIPVLIFSHSRYSKLPVFQHRGMGCAGHMNKCLHEKNS